VLILIGLLQAGLVASAAAEPRRIELTSGDTQVTFRAYGMGLLPIDARFARFSGWLNYDPGDRHWCRVELRVETASLATEDQSVRDTVAGPDFLDTVRYPMLGYTGACEAETLGGMLAMHGVTRPFELSVQWLPQSVEAEGRLLRADWGMTAMPLVGGRTVRIRVTVSLGAAGGADQPSRTKP